MDRTLKDDHSLRSCAEQYFTVVLCVIQFSPVCNFRKFTSLDSTLSWVSLLKIARFHENQYSGGRCAYKHTNTVGLLRRAFITRCFIPSTLQRLDKHRTHYGCDVKEGMVNIRKSFLRTSFNLLFPKLNIQNKGGKLKFFLCVRMLITQARYVRLTLSSCIKGESVALQLHCPKHRVSKSK